MFIKNKRFLLHWIINVLESLQTMSTILILKIFKIMIFIYRQDTARAAFFLQEMWILKRENAYVLKNHKRIWFFNEFQWISIVFTDARQWIFLNIVIIIYIFIFCLSFLLLFFSSLHHHIFMWQQQYTYSFYLLICSFVYWLSFVLFFFFYFYLSQCLFITFIYICQILYWYSWFCYHVRSVLSYYKIISTAKCEKAVINYIFYISNIIVVSSISKHLFIIYFIYEF